ncbi:LytTR family DNA-binding domain-containing protein [Haliovirga abyssi]|uniref:DNA-binding protein n=1 Tax=Haliovirga abyssi TaxID=2996794 RepID=A0AAU9DRT3_9FUSO|nr:LytTR family DNA-binding domain-containing protein [Haliovirga abyssi]BDU51313.1 DNA-binding protein [Haliovirga abyssi]
MKASLICEDKKFKIIKTLLEAKGIELDLNANTVFIDETINVEKDNKIYILFNSENLNQFLDFLDEFFCNNSNSNKDFIAGKDDEEIKLISLKKVQFFEADNNNIYCIVENEKKIYKIKEKLYELEEKLDSKEFMRVSKSNIVSIRNISQIIPWFDNKLIIKFEGTNKKVEVTRTYLKKFKKYLGV